MTNCLTRKWRIIKFRITIIVWLGCGRPTTRRHRVGVTWNVATYVSGNKPLNVRESTREATEALSVGTASLQFAMLSHLYVTSMSCSCSDTCGIFWTPSVALCSWVRWTSSIGGSGSCRDREQDGWGGEGSSLTDCVVF
jgi:hypothetical protein